MQPLAEYLCVDGAIASRAVVDLDGRYTGEMAFYAYGPYKAEAIANLALFEHIDLSASYAYSDSYTDTPMLEAVGHPVAVNPDRVLARLARERDWEVVQFVRPVRLRDRVPVPNLPTAAAMTGRRRCCDRASALLARRYGQQRQTLNLKPAAGPPEVSGFPEAPGGDKSEGDQDGENQELLHSRRS